MVQEIFIEKKVRQTVPSPQRFSITADFANAKDPDLIKQRIENQLFKTRFNDQLVKDLALTGNIIFVQSV